MRQEVGDHKGEVIQRKTRRTTQRTDNGALLLGGFPRELVRAARVVLAVGRATLTPLADGLGRDPIAAGQHARGLGGAGDLGPHGGGGGGFWVGFWPPGPPRGGGVGGGGVGPTPEGPG